MLPETLPRPHLLGPTCNLVETGPRAAGPLNRPIRDRLLIEQRVGGQIPRPRVLEDVEEDRIEADVILVREVFAMSRLVASSNSLATTII